MRPLSQWLWSAVSGGRRTVSSVRGVLESAERYPKGDQLLNSFRSTAPSTGVFTSRAT